MRTTKVFTNIINYLQDLITSNKLTELYTTIFTKNLQWACQKHHLDKCIIKIGWWEGFLKTSNCTGVALPSKVDGSRDATEARRDAISWLASGGSAPTATHRKKPPTRIMPYN